MLTSRHIAAAEVRHQQKELAKEREREECGRKTLTKKTRKETPTEKES